MLKSRGPFGAVDEDDVSSEPKLSSTAPAYSMSSTWKASKASAVSGINIIC